MRRPSPCVLQSSAPRRPIPPPAAAPAPPAGQPGGPIPPVDPARLSTNSRSPRPSSPVTAGPPTTWPPTWPGSRAEQPTPPNIPPLPHPEPPMPHREGRIRHPRPQNTQAPLCPRARGRQARRNRRRSELCRQTAQAATSTRFPKKDRHPVRLCTNNRTKTNKNKPSTKTSRNRPE